MVAAMIVGWNVSGLNDRLETLPVDPELLVMSDHVIDANMLGRTWIEMEGDALAKEDPTELSLLALGHGHVVSTGKDQLAILFVFLTICFCQAPLCQEGVGLSPCAGV